MLSAIENAFARAGRRAALGICASILIAVGIGFLTTAGWIVLEVAFGALQAALIIAAIYSGVGLVIIGVLMSSGDSEQTPKPETTETAAKAVTAPPLVEAFLYGLQAGSHASNARRS
ncbi:hypothetical protein [Cognatishimia sp. MH4019]|uniref:hypothetical protein n=1 Tax=Cognatishimia sp. MH4019 TaxID=2854030 RepID=UPI001CD77AC0|nr:hypothetical protein [Cognatishimia sp. MH4019]